MKTIKASIANPKMKKSWGQKIAPNNIKRPSTTLSRNKGLPFIEINGRQQKTLK
jgi:hypothetical protein